LYLDFILGRIKPEKALPLYTILTIPATGSEMNMGLVLTNDETLDKFGWGNPVLSPVVSILDPTLTLTLPENQTAFTSVDIIAHSIEAYFTKEDNDTPFLNGYVENLVKSVMNSTNRLVKNPKDLGARSNLMWTATMAWNGLNHCGVGKFYLNNHQLEHPISALYSLAMERALQY
jgi:alcohol dehydrogenase YqhD (iron-dependent ADH family)